MKSEIIERGSGGKYKKGSSGNLNGQATEVCNVSKELPVSAQVVERLNALKFCPITKLVDLARNSRSEKVQYEAAAKLADKVAPSLKSIEVEGNSVGNGYCLNIYYSKSAQEVSEDKYNMVLSQLNKKVIHDS